MHIFVIAAVQNRIVGAVEEIFHRVPQRRDGVFLCASNTVDL